MLNVRNDSFVVTAEGMFKVVFSLFNLFTSDEMFNILQLQNGWEFLVKTLHWFLSKDQPPPTLQLQDLDPGGWGRWGVRGSMESK